MPDQSSRISHLANDRSQAIGMLWTFTTHGRDY
jgi:hypothetical protein